MDEIPVVKVFKTKTWSGKDQVCFWCPFCKRIHRHGGGTPNKQLVYGHRVAHCSENTPFKKKGYILKGYTKKEMKELFNQNANNKN